MKLSNVYDVLRWGSTSIGLTPGSANGCADGARRRSGDRSNPRVRSTERPASDGTSAAVRGGVTPSGNSTRGGRSVGGTLAGWRAGSSIDAPRRDPDEDGSSRSITMS